MIERNQDAQGRAMMDFYEGKRAFEIIQRDDGYFDVSGGPELYFREFEDWKDIEKEAMDYVEGRVIDIGCGAGKHSIYLQRNGFEVTGVDISPHAIEVARKRGLEDVRGISISEINQDMGKFRTILLMGNNFGLLESCTGGKEYLRKFHQLTVSKARIIAETRDPYATEMKEHLEYHKFNRERGRMGGQLRLRVLYRKYKTPWFDYLLVSREELEDILRDTGWEIEKIMVGDAGIYIAIMRKIKPG